MTTSDDPVFGYVGTPAEGEDPRQPDGGSPDGPPGGPRASMGPVQHPGGGAEAPGADEVPLAGPARGQPGSRQPNAVPPNAPNAAPPNAAGSAGGPDDVLARYCDIAAAAMSDAEIWLRQGALSRVIPEAIPDAILVTNEAGIIILVNAQFELMFGYHRSEVLGNIVEMLLPEALRARHVEYRHAFAARPRVRALGENLELIGRRKNGLEFRALIKLGPVVIPAGVYTIAVIRSVPD
jgi:PAS domain S-box-containing protein